MFGLFECKQKFSTYSDVRSIRNYNYYRWEVLSLKEDLSINEDTFLVQAVPVLAPVFVASCSLFSPHAVMLWFAVCEGMIFIYSEEDSAFVTTYSRASSVH